MPSVGCGSTKPADAGLPTLIRSSSRAPRSPTRSSALVLRRLNYFNCSATRKTAGSACTPIPSAVCRIFSDLIYPAADSGDGRRVSLLKVHSNGKTRVQRSGKGSTRPSSSRNVLSMCIYGNLARVVPVRPSLPRQARPLTWLDTRQPSCRVMEGKHTRAY